MKRNISLLFFIPLTLIMIIISCKSENKIQDTVISIRLPKDPGILNPLVYSSSLGREVYQYIFLPLADYDPASLDLKPILIERIPEKKVEKNGISYGFRIKNEAKWDDGLPITGKDYEFTLKAVLNPGSNAAAYRTLLGRISQVEVSEEDSRKVTVFFEDDFPLSLETCINFELYPQHIYDPKNVLGKYSFEDFKNYQLDSTRADGDLIAFTDDFNGLKHSKNIIHGAGPYQLVEWTSDQSIKLKKVENYWGKDTGIPACEQNIDEIIFQIIADGNTAFTQFVSDNIDVLPALSSSQYDEIVQSPQLSEKYEILTPQLMKYYFVLLNNRQELLKHKEVRQALNHLIDRKQLIDIFENGKAQIINAPFHPSKPYYNHDLKNVEYSVNQAREILESQGWHDTNNNGTLDKNLDGKVRELELTLYESGSEMGDKIALLISEAGKKAGIKLDIIKKSFRLIAEENIATDEFDMVLAQASQDLSIDDPYSKWHSSRIGKKSGNDANYFNEKVDSLCEKIRLENSMEALIPLFEELETIMYDDCPVLFLYSPIERIGVNQRFKGQGTSKRPGYMANTFEYIGQE